MDATLLSTVRQLRAKHPTIGTRGLLAWARSKQHPGMELTWETRDLGQVARLSRDGFDIEVSFDLDEAPDVSWLGSFTDDGSKPGAIPNPGIRYWGDRDHVSYTGTGTYRWYVPGNSYDDHRQGLTERGYSRGNADYLARQYVLADYRRLTSDAFALYDCQVTVRRNGIELGFSSLGGIDLGTDLPDVDVDEQATQVVVDHGLIDEAVENAVDNLAALRTEITNLPATGVEGA